MRDVLVLLLASLVVWGLGIYLNRVRPKLELDRTMARRREMVTNSVVAGRFSVGTRHPAQLSREQAEADARWFLAEEEKRLRQERLGQHSLLWIPMQYYGAAFSILSAVALLSFV